MRVVHLSTYDMLGGAARAALRLHRALLSTGTDSHMLVRRRFGEADDRIHAPHGFVENRAARIRRRLDGLIGRVFGASQQPKFSPALTPDGLNARIKRLSPDVLNLHWVNDGLLKTTSIASMPCPVVWTLHDMWPFTGGCHYSGDCNRFTNSCGFCPLLATPREHDVSRSVWRAKEKAYSLRTMTIVAPSRWMADKARRSSLFRDHEIHVIPNSLDFVTFRPLDREIARKALGLPDRKRIILGGSVSFRTDPRKGFHHFEKICRELSELSPDDYQFVVFGGRVRESFHSGGITVTDIGTIETEERMAQVYSAADVFVSVSREDNLPNTIMESLACGTPVAAFSIGGIPDMVHDGENGLLEDRIDPVRLAYRIHDLTSNQSLLEENRRYASERCQADYSPDVIANKYREIYSSLFEKRSIGSS